MVSDLLHLKPEDITDIEITNPIILGETIDDKEFHLDINAILNGNKNVNLTKPELATDEDKKYKIDVWARLFKANS